MSEDLIELIRLMNEKPIAFNKHYVQIGCGINGALMLSQLIYWADKAKDRNGWIYKTNIEWTEETGLTRREQDTARKNLKELGLIEEHKHGVPCKVHFKVNQVRLYELLISVAQKRQTVCTNQPNCLHESAKLDAQIRTTNTESTADITTENTKHIKGVKKFDPLKAPIPKHVDYRIWCDFVEMRKQIKKPLTERATTLITNKLIEFGVNGNASLEQSIASGWSSIFPVKSNNRGTDNFHDSFYGVGQSPFGKQENNQMRDVVDTPLLNYEDTRF